MSELAIEDRPVLSHDVAQQAARGQVVYLTDHGHRVAAIVPARIAAELERMSPDELAELLEDFADAAAARQARQSIENGVELVPWGQVKREADL
jgi:antitoxin (DNA-binding transcriptional repressor) of toxin-antitoxin stability system